MSNNDSADDMMCRKHILQQSISDLYEKHGGGFKQFYFGVKVFEGENALSMTRSVFGPRDSVSEGIVFSNNRPLVTPLHGDY